MTAICYSYSEGVHSSSAWCCADFRQDVDRLDPQARGWVTKNIKTSLWTPPPLLPNLPRKTFIFLEICLEYVQNMLEIPESCYKYLKFIENNLEVQFLEYSWQPF